MEEEINILFARDGLVIPDILIFDERKVKVEFTHCPKVISSYDPVQDIIFLNYNLMKNPEFLKYSYNHELKHARHKNKFFIHIWIDIQTWFTRNWKQRKEMSEVIDYNKYWKVALANIFLQFFFLGIIVSSLLLGIAILKLLL